MSQAEDESEPLIMASPRRLPRRQSQGLNNSNSVNVESSTTDIDRPRMLGNNAVVVETPILSLGGIETVEVAVPSSALAFTAHPGELMFFLRIIGEKTFFFFFFFFF
jgi:hypothetical protein